MYTTTGTEDSGRRNILQRANQIICLACVFAKCQDKDEPNYIRVVPRGGQ